MQQLAFAWLGTAVFAASLGYFLYSYLFTFGVSSAGNPRGLWHAVLTDVLLFTIFALHHSLFARTRLKRVVHRLLPPALERSAYSVVASLLFLWVCAWWQPVPGQLYAVPAPWRWLGYALQAAALVLTVRAARALDVLDLSGVRQVMAASTGTSQTHHPLKTTGLFALVRHPLYFAWALFVFSAPDMTLTRFTFAVVSTAYLALAIPFEERSLIQTFGSSYQEYRRQTRWRMLPGLY